MSHHDDGSIRSMLKDGAEGGAEVKAEPDDGDFDEQQTAAEPSDVTMVMDDEVDDVINGGDDEEFNFASALALRKNLTSAFDKHAGSGAAAAAATATAGAGASTKSTAAGGKGGGSSGGPKKRSRVDDGGVGKAAGGSVKLKIAKLEKAKGGGKKAFGGGGGQRERSAKPPRFAKKAAAAAAGGGGTAGGQKKSKAGNDKKSSRPRPPKVPSQASRKGGGADGSSSSGGGSLLSVYLRIRPPVGGSNAFDSSSEGQEAAAANTIEMLPPSAGEGVEKKDGAKAANGTSSTTTTTIRTYPPQDSNAARVVRAQHPHPSSDVIFGNNPNNTGSDEASGRGVKEYEFSSVFGPASTQADVYDSVAAPLVRGLFPPAPPTSTDGKQQQPKEESKGKGATASSNAPLVGQSALLFAYGITNAGKTHTIMGNGGSGEGEKTKKVDTSRQAGVPSAAPAAADDLNPNRGVIPRALHDILERMKDSGGSDESGNGTRYTLNMSYFEIYNEQVFDLIGRQSGKNKQQGSNSASSATSAATVSGKPTTGAGPPQPHSSSSSSARSKPLGGNINGGPVPLKLRESRDGTIFVKGLTRHRVSSVARGLELARLAMSKRHTSSNNINSDSSRSHSVCQLELVAHPPTVPSAEDDDNDDASAETGSVASASGYSTEDEAATLRSKENRSVSMWIVDLAGSERSKRTGAVNKSARQKEAALINSSLMKLMRCLHTLRDNQSRPGVGPSSSHAMVPFRESKLTHLFTNHLTGASASRTSMIVNVNPSAADYDETQHVLSYATVARSIVISEDDYDRKRRAIAMNSTGHTHDGNGRSLSRPRNGGGREKSPPRKIARLAAKLSPRSMLAKRREQQADAQKRKAQLQGTRGGSSRALSGKGSAAAGGVGPIKKLAKLSSGSTSKELEEKDRSIKQHLEEIERLRSDLTAAQGETASARSVIFQLREQLSQREAEIRMELAEEMEAQMKAMRQHYNTIVDRLKQQLQSQPTPGKSARKVKLDKAEQVIEELMDQVEECEEDMARQRVIHEEEMENLTKLHNEALATKDQQIAELNELLEDDDASASTSTESLLEENKSPAPHMVKRLPRQRASEVACSASPPPTSEREPQSSSKKKGLFRSKIASPGKKQDSRKPLSPLPMPIGDSNPSHDRDSSISDRSYS